MSYFNVKHLKRFQLSSCFNFLMIFFKKFAKECIICTTFFSISCGLLGIVYNEILQHLIDNLHNFEKTKIYIFYLFICFLTSELSTYLGKLIYSNVLPKIELNIRLSLFSYIQTLSIKYFYHTDHGAIENMINNTSEGTREAMEDIIMEIMPSIIFALISNIFLFLLDWKIGLLCTVKILIYCILYYMFSKSILENGKKVFKIINERTGTTIEMIQNMKLSKILHLENYTLEKMHNVSQEEMNFLKKYFKNTSKTGFLAGTLLVVLDCIMIFFIIYILKDQNITSGKIMGLMNVVFSASFYLYSASKQTIDVFLNISRINQSLNRLFNAPEDNIKGYKVNVPIESINIKNLTFNFNNNKILNNFSINIPFKSKICIMGPSGSGKSTLLNILSKMINIEDNSIFINGMDINDIDPVYYRSNISYITQSNFMFHSTVFENISIGKLGVSIDEVIKVAKKAQIHDFIMKLPNGYYSDVGVNSSFLSGGQIQRICIARALLNDGKIIICDEPLSALDGITSVNIINNILEISKEKTLIWVDHSCLVAPLVDTVILFNKDKSISIGNHFDLLKINKEYSELYNK